MNTCYILAILILLISTIEVRCQTTDVPFTTNTSDPPDSESGRVWDPPESNIVQENPCDSNVCVHATECINLVYDYLCNCDPGFTGKNCDIEMNECESLPCLNNGTCLDGPNMFTCSCLNGFEGPQCETNIDDCATEPCLNGGICNDGISNYTCRCPDAYRGANCENLFNACAAMPCMNNAACITTPGQQSYYCECSLGYDGTNCDNNINDCIGVVCENGTICFDLISSYECQCTKGYEGANCEREINECLPNPCLNSATCVDQISNYTCNCLPGFTGINCESDINECETITPCVNGICVNSIGSYECYCRPGYSGNNCSLEFDECLYLPCQNGGSCINKINNYECLCSPGFTGRECQIDIDECASNPCQNNATCVDGIASFTCNCIPGFTDNICATNIDECELNPCQNEGICIDGINIYSCNCTDTGFKGEECEINIDDCASHPCQHGSQCNDLIKDYMCDCFEGYTGKQCEEDLLECSSSPCQNGGTCLEYSNMTLYELGIFSNFSFENAGGFMCECILGFTGKHCEINIDECEVNPCQNGDCVDGINSYFCQCLLGYEGSHCEDEIDECTSYLPCVHGHCQDMIGDYSCTCDPSYGGKNCSVELMGCRDIECANVGTCIPSYHNDTHYFMCDCQSGFIGNFCEKSTTFSLDGAGYILLDSTDINGYDLKMSFRTTLPNVVLAVGQAEAHFFTLVLQNGRIKLHASFLNRYNGIFAGSDLNDGAWKQARLYLNETHAHLTAHNETVVHEVSEEASGTSFISTSLGGVTENLKILVTEPKFTGCMQDISLGATTVVPLEHLATSKVNVMEGCNREDQCEENPCESEGMCVDLWSSFQCLCKRPFWGETCSERFLPATFGNENTRDSIVFVNIPHHLQQALQYQLDVSLLIRTRHPNGIVFYVGSDLQNTTIDDPEVTFILAELVNGMIRVRVKLGNLEEIFEVSDNQVKLLDDGQLHLIHVKREELNVIISVDEESILMDAIQSGGILIAEAMYLGGIPTTEQTQALSREKRQLGETHPTQNNIPNFKGVIQDVRLTGGNQTRFVNFFPTSPSNETDSDIPAWLPATNVFNVLNGTISDDTCSLQPCEQNGTCTVTFNDFQCNCPTGYKGKRCEELEFCGLYECPEGSTCQNLVDGYECLSEATFNGRNSSFSYIPDLRNATVIVKKVSASFRSKIGGILISTSTPEGSMSINLSADSLTIEQWNETRIISHYTSPSILDGLWHNINVSFAGDFIEVYFDENLLTTNDNSLVITNLHQIISNGVATLGHKPVNQGAFRGCMKEVRLEDILLPFYSKEQLIYDRALNTFRRENVVSLDLGCKVCFQTECRNGGFCSDPASLYDCACPAGFNGSMCEINIDECVENTCMNGATCLDGINSYTCKCSPGYSGIFCEEDINECASNPCQNNGTCHNEIAMFHCHCTADYIGELCQELKIKNCSNNQCQNGATCKDIFNDNKGIADDYRCLCPFSYEGKNCQFEVNFCRMKNIECVHGSCIHTHVGEGWQCLCEAGYEDTYCEVEIDECMSQPCLNGGSCRDTFLDYECVCQDGWRGKQCEQNINECEEDPFLCKNGAKCRDADGYFFCDCMENFCGTHCALTDPCSINTLNCSQHGECTSICDEPHNDTKAICACYEDWKGLLCDIKISPLTTESITIIIGVVLGLMVIIAVVGLTIFLMMAKKKRETSGTYSPSKQEFYSPTVEMGNMMKPPPEERLI